MHAIELMMEVGEDRRLTLQLPEGVPPDAHRLIVVLADVASPPDDRPTPLDRADLPSAARARVRSPHPTLAQCMTFAGDVIDSIPLKTGRIHREEANRPRGTRTVSGGSGASLASA